MPLIATGRRHFIHKVGVLAGAATMSPLAVTRAMGASNATAFGPLQQARAGVLDIGYVDAGPSDGPVVILLHGWPYDNVGATGDRRCATRRVWRQ